MVRFHFLPGFEKKLVFCLYRLYVHIKQSYKDSFILKDLKTILRGQFSQALSQVFCCCLLLFFLILVKNFGDLNGNSYKQLLGRPTCI